MTASPKIVCSQYWVIKVNGLLLYYVLYFDKIYAELKLLFSVLLIFDLETISNDAYDQLLFTNLRGLL